MPFLSIACLNMRFAVLLCLSPGMCLCVSMFVCVSMYICAFYLIMCVNGGVMYLRADVAQSKAVSPAPSTITRPLRAGNDEDLQPHRPSGYEKKI